ncbi:unnamed protein product [Phytophthora fragariaefolia]|uniref:Unnamed protein product n=1 Tax=Phytophthora fragariaefolia TaxID=1490495 RepID=A0A9W6YPS3_9STRA|nr:unnamed protein product [Phytophthora fragariaefolia]
MQYKPYFEEKNLIWYQGSTDEQARIVVPNIVALQHRIIAEVHDTNYGGHPGADRTYLKLRSDWYWPRMVHRDTKVVSGFWSQVFENVGTKLKMTVAYRAQGDGQTGRTNRTLEEYLRCFVSPRQDDWDVHLANAEFAINSAVNSSIKMSPFEADIGYIPRNPIAAVVATKRLGLRGGRRHGVKFTDHQDAVLRQCQETLEDAQARTTVVYDRGQTEQVFKVGDQVYLSTKHLDTAHTGFPNSRKLGRKWIGLYPVVRTVHNHAYEINLPPGLKLHPVFNTGSLKPYDTPTRLSRPNQ